MGELPLVPLGERVVGPGRPGQQPVRARPQPVRVELRLRRGHVGQPVRSGDRHRDRRLDRVPGGRQRRGRDQTDPRADEPGGGRADRGLPGHRWTPWPHRRRCRGRARCDRQHGRRPPRPGDGGEPEPGVLRLHPVPRPRRARRGADRCRPGGGLRVQRGDRCGLRGSDRGDPRRRRHGRRPRRHPDDRPDQRRRRGDHRLALRVQAGPQCLPRHPHRRADQDARRRDRLQRSARRRRVAVVPPGTVPGRPKRDPQPGRLRGGAG